MGWRDRFFGPAPTDEQPTDGRARDLTPDEVPPPPRRKRPRRTGTVGSAGLIGGWNGAGDGGGWGCGDGGGFGGGGDGGGSC